MRTRHWLAVACVALSTAARADVRYTVTELGALIGEDLSNTGEAVLNIANNGPGVLWDGTRLTFVPISSLPPGDFKSLVFAMNDKGQLAGAAHLGNPGGGDPGGTLLSGGDTVFWPGGSDQPAVVTGKNADVGRPVSVTASGQVFLRPFGSSSLTVWSPDTGLVPVPYAGPSTNWWQVNDSGMAVGDFTAADGMHHAITYKDGQIHPLDSGAWAHSLARAVANDGEVAGIVANASLSQILLALWSPAGALETFALPVSNAYGVWGVNSAHQVLLGPASGPWLFENGTFEPLSTLVPAGTKMGLDGADASIHLNETGQVLFTRSLHNDFSMTYEDTILLTPTSPMARALSIAGGLQTNSASDLGELDTQAPAGIDLVDAVRLARRAAGLE